MTKLIGKRSKKPKANKNNSWLWLGDPILQLLAFYLTNFVL